MKKSELRQLIREQIKQVNLKEEGVLGFNSEEEFMQMLLDYVREAGKTDELLQMLKAQGMSEEEIKYILDYIGLTLEEGLGDQIGAALKGAGQGISSVLGTVIGAVVIAGVLVLRGAAALATGVLAVAGIGAFGLLKAVNKFILIPKVNATLRRLSEDEEVMAIAMKPTASGLRKVAGEKLTASERIMVGNFIKDNITRDMLGVSRRYRGGKTVGVKSKKGPGLKPGDETPLSPFGLE